jgi:hypothetical protein
MFLWYWIYVSVNRCIIIFVVTCQQYYVIYIEQWLQSYVHNIQLPFRWQHNIIFCRRHYLHINMINEYPTPCSFSSLWFRTYILFFWYFPLEFDSKRRFFFLIKCEWFLKIWIRSLFNTYLWVVPFQNNHFEIIRKFTKTSLCLNIA